MAQTDPERRAAHRAGQSSSMAKRVSLASQSAVCDTQEQRVVFSNLPRIAGAITTANTAYWVYVGRSSAQFTINKVEFAVTTSAVGTQAAEVAIATSPLGPNKAAQVLTVVAVNATLTDLTAAAGMNANTVAMAYLVPDTGLHLWAGVRFNMGTTQPQCYGLTGDFSEGQVLSTAAAGVLAVGTYTGALITHAVTWQCVDLRACVD